MTEHTGTRKSAGWAGKHAGLRPSRNAVWQPCCRGSSSNPRTEPALFILLIILSSLLVPASYCCPSRPRHKKIHGSLQTRKSFSTLCCRLTGTDVCTLTTSYSSRVVRELLEVTGHWVIPEVWAEQGDEERRQQCQMYWGGQWWCDSELDCSGYEVLISLWLHYKFAPEHCLFGPSGRYVRAKGVKQTFLLKIRTCKFVGIHRRALHAQYLHAPSVQNSLYYYGFFSALKFPICSSVYALHVFFILALQGQSTFTTKQVRQGRRGGREGREMSRWAKLVSLDWTSLRPCA